MRIRNVSIQPNLVITACDQMLYCITVLDLMVMMKKKQPHCLSRILNSCILFQMCVFTLG